MILGNRTRSAAFVMTFAVTAVTLLWNCLNMPYCSRKRKKKNHPRPKLLRRCNVAAAKCWQPIKIHPKFPGNEARRVVRQRDEPELFRFYLIFFSVLQDKLDARQRTASPQREFSLCAATVNKCTSRSPRPKRGLSLILSEGVLISKPLKHAL